MIPTARTAAARGLEPSASRTVGDVDEAAVSGLGEPLRTSAPFGNAQNHPRYRCPSCAGQLIGVPVPTFAAEDGAAPPAVAQACYRCIACGRRYPVIDDIASLITEDDLADHAPFLAHYRRVRTAEGWAVEPEVLGALPYATPGVRYEAIWRRRALSYERLLAIIATRWPARSLDILDLGAGNCWLSIRLAERGHRVEAVDINVDDTDGLGACRDLVGAVAARAGIHRTARVGTPGAAPVQPRPAVHIARVQASFGCLPYADTQFDLVVASASLHYARDLPSAIAEAARVLRPGGALVLLDTPIYNQARAGWELAEQRLASQRRRYGSDGVGTAGPGFIERAALRHSMRRAGLGYREVQVHGRLRSLLGRVRRSIRALAHRPERAQMPLVVGYRP